MSKQKLLEEYRNHVETIRKRARTAGLGDDEIARLFEDCFRILDGENHKTQKFISSIAKVFFTTITVVFFLYVLLNVHQPTSSIVLRNVQGLIHPGLKVLRSISVPVIKNFPSLTSLYDESCLVENPFFYVSDMECWPCENVHSVIDLTGFDNHSLYQSGIPYIVKTQQKVINFETLHNLYMTHKAIFNAEANNIRSSDSSVKNLEQFFDKTKLDGASAIWRVNKMTPARLVRSLFPKPYIVPDRAGQSMERFVFFGGNDKYTFPNTECSYVFAIQGSGERTLILKPSRECGEACRTISVVLKPSYVLWYNWWYWRPISLPNDNSTIYQQPSITYIGSYC